MISKTNCTLLDNEKPVFNENICEPTEFAVCYEPRAIRALRDKIINLLYVNNLYFWACPKKWQVIRYKKTFHCFTPCKHLAFLKYV